MNVVIRIWALVTGKEFADFPFGGMEKYLKIIGPSVARVD